MKCENRLKWIKSESEYVNSKTRSELEQAGTTWNVLELLRTSWNHLERAETTWKKVEPPGTRWNQQQTNTKNKKFIEEAVCTIPLPNRIQY